MPIATAIEITGSEIRRGDIFCDKKIAHVDAKITNVKVTYEDLTWVSFSKSSEVSVIRDLPTWADLIAKKGEDLDTYIAKVAADARSAAANGRSIGDFKARVSHASSAYELLNILGNVRREARWLQADNLLEKLAVRLDRIDFEMDDVQITPRAYLADILEFVEGVRVRKDGWSAPSDGNPIDLAEYDALSDMLSPMVSVFPMIVRLAREVNEMAEARKDEMDEVAD